MRGGVSAEVSGRVSAIVYFFLSLSPGEINPGVDKLVSGKVVIGCRVLKKGRTDIIQMFTAGSRTD